MALAVALTLLLTGTIAGVSPAWAVDYPSWDDVAAVRNDEAATKAEVARIESLLAGLQAEAA